MRHTVKEWIEDVRMHIADGNTQAIERAINHPKMLYSTTALNEVARTGDHNLLAYALDRALGASIMDLTAVFKTLAHGGHVQSVQQLLEWAQSNNTFDAKNPYLRTVVMAAVERDCVDILRANAHQLHTIPQGFMKSYYFKAVECESLHSLDFFEDHMDTKSIQRQSFELALEKFKPSSVQYFLRQHKNPIGKVRSIVMHICLRNDLKDIKGVPTPISDTLLVLMDYATPDEILGPYISATPGRVHPLQNILHHINDTVRAQKQAQRLNSEIKDVALPSKAGRKI